MLFFLILIHLALTVFILFLVWGFTKGDVANFFREPIAITLLGLCIIHGIVPPLQYSIGFYRYGGDYSLWAYIYSVVLAFIFICVMLFSYTLSSSKLSVVNQELFPMSVGGKMYLILIMIIPSVLAALVYYNAIKGFGYQEFMRDRIGFGRMYGGPKLLISRWMYVSFFVCVAGFFSSRGRDKLMLALAVILGILTIGYFGYLCSRNSIIIAFVTALGIYFATTQRPRISIMRMLFSKVSLIIFGLAVCMVVLGDIRAKNIGLYVGPSTFDKVIHTLNGAFGNHENVVFLVDNDFDLQYGKTYLAGFITPIIPRAIWPNKPTGAGPMLKNLVDPGSYEIGKRGISSLTTGMVTESYMNGGLLGVIIIAAITGVVIALISRSRFRCIGPWSLSLYAYTLIVFAYSLTYGEFVGIYTRWFVDIFPVVIGFLLFEYRIYLLLRELPSASIDTMATSYY